MNKLVPAVVIKSKFITSSNDSKFKDYLNYMDRKNTHSFENDFENYQDYQDYMSNSEKSTGIFTLDKDSLTEDEKIQLKDIFKESQENKSVLWQDVISFDNDWLRECGILKNDFLDEKKLKQATRNAMTEMLKKEGMEDSALWSGAIHYNTDNIHIHVATVQVKDFRERGKRKQKSIDVMKSKVASTLLDRSKENQKLNEFIRERVVNTKRQDNMTSLKNRVLNRELVNQFKTIHSMLPEDKRLWQYSMNGIANVRPEIDKFTQIYIEKYFKNEFKEFNKQLDKEVEIYKRTYGDNSRAEQYRETKMNDLYKRMGNTVLKEIKQYDSDLQSAAFKKNSTLKKIKVNKGLNEVFYRMDRAMNDNLDHFKNQREFERLQHEKEREQEYGR
jgi:hypothetical protein